MPKQEKNGRFAAFSFVDRIIEIEGLSRATGCFTIPTHVTNFPVSLVAEAIGQLAAWVAMSHVDFKFRPVAALAGDTRIFKKPQPGDTLELEVDIESCDEQSIVYRGRARINQKIVLELLDTLGSMLDIKEFDDPKRLRADFACLISSGRTPGAFLGVPQPLVTAVSVEQGCEFELNIPKYAAFFDDHFPSRPVFPATLLIDALLSVAQPLTEKVVGRQVIAIRISHVKVRAFTAPGTTLVLFVQAPEPVTDELNTWCVKVGARNAGKTIAGARLYFSSTF